MKILPKLLSETFYLTELKRQNGVLSDQIKLKLISGIYLQLRFFKKDSTVTPAKSVGRSPGHLVSEESPDSEDSVGGNTSPP